MTDKSKQWIKEYGFNALSLALLLIIVGMVGYYIQRLDSRMEAHAKRISDLETISYNLGQSCINYNQWQQQHQSEFNAFRDLTQSEILELWKMMPRSANIKK